MGLGIPYTRISTMKNLLLSAIIALIVVSLTSHSRALECRIGDEDIIVTGIMTLKKAEGNRLTEGLNELYAIVVFNDEDVPIKIIDVGLNFTVKGWARINLNSVIGHPVEDIKKTNSVGIVGWV